MPQAEELWLEESEKLPEVLGDSAKEALTEPDTWMEGEEEEELLGEPLAVAVTVTRGVELAELDTEEEREGEPVLLLEAVREAPPEAVTCWLPDREPLVVPLPLLLKPTVGEAFCRDRLGELEGLALAEPLRDMLPEAEPVPFRAMAEAVAASCRD